MKTENIYKAQRTLKSQEVPSVKIVVDAEVPDAQSLFDADEIYRLEAERLCAALEASLPGGTFDRLLIEMMKRKASHFKVAFENVNQPRSVDADNK